jgi:hypothetical protein
MFSFIFKKSQEDELMQDINEPIKFRNLEYDSDKPLSKEYILRARGRFFKSINYNNSYIISPRKMTFEYIVDGVRLLDIGTFKPKLLDNLSSFIHRMQREPNEWEIDDIIKSSISVKDYNKTIAPYGAS